MDKVFKALADPGRRLLLDRLHAENGQTLGQLCEHLDMTRQAVTKHLKLLEEAKLVVTSGGAARSCTTSTRCRSTRSPIAGSASTSGAGFARSPTSRKNWKERPMAESRFVYVTYIRTTPEKLWQALIEPEFTRQYWCETWQECEWKPGASWRLMAPDGRVADSGEILEIEPHRRLVLTWRNEFLPELHAEGYSRLTYELEAAGRLGQAHPDPRDGRARLEAHRRRVERLAGDPVQPQEPAGNGRIAGGNPPLAEGDLERERAGRGPALLEVLAEDPRPITSS